MIYLNLFLSFFKIGILGLGGGYAFLPLIQEEAVNQGYINPHDFANLLALAEMTPGPLALNTASYVGMKTAGIPGSLIASFSVVLPGLLLGLLFFWLMNKPKFEWWRKSLVHLRPTLAALIVYAGVKIFLTDWEAPNSEMMIILLFLVSLTAYLWFKIHPALVILFAGVFGTILFFGGVTI